MDGDGEEEAKPGDGEAQVAVDNSYKRPVAIIILKKFATCSYHALQSYPETMRKYVS